MPEHDLITLPKILTRLPGLCRGLPRRMKGLYMASRQLDAQEAGLAQCLARAVAKNPTGLAIAYEEREITYRELDGWSSRLANYLRQSGTQAGDVVAVFIENRPELLAVVAALAKLGAVAALLNTSQRGRVLQHSIALAEPARIVVGEELHSAANEVAEVLPQGRHACLYMADCDTLKAFGKAPAGWSNLAQAAAEQSSLLTHVHVTLGRDPLCYFYTSGTTGLPKAAVLSNSRYMKAFAGVGVASVQLGKQDRALVPLPFYHGTAMVVGWGSVLAGAAGLVMTRKFSASEFWPLVRKHQVTAFCYVGELCRYLLAQPESRDDREHSLKLMFGNGLRPAIWKAFKQRFGIEQVLEFYGSSEGNVGFLNLLNFDATVGLTTVPYAIVEYDLEQDAPKRHGDGFMRKVKRGDAGLLLGEITDDSPFDGYTDADKTEGSILRNVFKAGDAWFNTGDLMRDQGYRHAQFVDRLGDTFRWKGENVSTTEVENVLAGHDDVVDAVVYGVEIPGTNGRAGMLAVRSEGENFDPNILLSTMDGALAPYAVPLFVREVGEVSTTGTHKYQKTQLKKDAFDPQSCGEALWVLLPGSERYERLTPTIYKAIVAGKYRF